MEFALIAPLLLLLLVGIFDVARIVNAYVTISNASREGAHWASLHPTENEAAVVQKAISPRVVPLNPTTPAPMSVQVSYYDAAASTFRPLPSAGIPASSPGPRSVPVRVTVGYQISTVTLFVGSMLGQLGTGTTLTTSSTAETIR